MFFAYLVAAYLWFFDHHNTEVFMAISITDYANCLI